MIFTTAYTSQMVQPLSDAELIDLLVSSRARNAERGVTGLLLYRAGRVLQMLEGDEAAVRELYDRIAMDVRHRQVTNVWTSVAAERRFPDWKMGFEDLDHVRPQVQRELADETTADGWDPLIEHGARPTSEQDDFLRRRTIVLRRALADGGRLVAGLAIILNGHDPEPATDADGTDYLRCRTCRSADDAVLNNYPCPTAKNALWALEAAGPR